MCETQALGQVFHSLLLCPWRRSRQCPMALGGMLRNSAAISLHLVGSLQRKKAGASLRRCLHQTVSALCCLRDPGPLGSGLVLASNPRMSLLFQEAFPDCTLDAGPSLAFASNLGLVALHLNGCLVLLPPHHPLCPAHVGYTVGAQ